MSLLNLYQMSADLIITGKSRQNLILWKFFYVDKLKCIFISKADITSSVLYLVNTLEIK